MLAGDPVPAYTNCEAQKAVGNGISMLEKYVYVVAVAIVFAVIGLCCSRSRFSLSLLLLFVVVGGVVDVVVVVCCCRNG